MNTALPLNGFANIKDCKASGRICGVYILFYGSRAIYVGQSIDIQARIANHKVEKPYTRCLVKQLPEETLNEVERALITVLQPPLNKSGVIEDRQESEYAHRLVALADLVKRVSSSSGWHDAAAMAKAENIIRQQALAVAKKHKERGW